MPEPIEINDLIRELATQASKRHQTPNGLKVIVVDSHCNTLYVRGVKLIQCTSDGVVVQLDVE